MVENLWQKAVFILVLLALSLGLFAKCGVPLGLDLRGGARLVYRLDIEKARAAGQIDPQADDKQITEETISVLEGRINPQGTLEASIMSQGSDRILIEIPGRQETEVAQVRSRITQLGKLEFRLVIDESMKTFDLSEEKKRLKDWLAKPENQALVGRNPEEISVFNALPADRGGPKRPGVVAWIPVDEKADPHSLEVSEKIQWTDARGEKQEGFARYMPVTLEAMHFTGEHLDAGSIKQTADDRGLPAVAFALTAAKEADFAEFTGQYKDRAFAIILNNKVRSAPVIQSKIVGSGVINGGSRGFGREELLNLILTLKTGSLKIKPELESESTIGPTVGEQAIRTGTISMILGALATVLFMLGYYRRLGSIAVLALLANMALLLGAMALFRFTMTLPGLAGLVLTMGMAVDANILIFERIREELEKGKVLAQAVKNGFQMALSTIVDANVTTLITALILYKVGTGPVRGFAVTLSVGIITSVFSALVISRLLCEIYLRYGLLKEARMCKLFDHPNFPFLSLRNPFFAVSGILIVLGLVVFAITDKQTKLGIDFTGGIAARVILKEPQKIDEVRGRITAEIPGAVVNTLGGSVVQEGGALTHLEGDRAQSFAVKFKLETGEQEAQSESKEIGALYRERLNKALGEWLVSPPFSDIRIWEGTDPTFVVVQMQVHLEAPVRLEDVRRALSGFDKLEVAAAGAAAGTPETAKDIRISMAMEPGVRQDELPDRLGRRLADVKGLDGQPLVLTEPIPEFSMIGTRVVGELQTSAILAILLSLFGIVMYIRVRFHEFRYGIAAVLALVHDIFIALGAVTLVNRLGLVSAEIDLPQIAAFLTIIGYSLNDTIVVFDRIRENLPRLPGSYEQILNTSINQTLSRTIWTSGTTLMVLLTIFVMNVGQRNVLEGFSFSMIIGIVVGTYSSIFIASPVLLLLHHRAQRSQAGSEPAKA